MSINLQPVLASVEAILKNAYTQDSPAVEAAIAGYLVDAKKTFKDISDGVVAGALSYNFVVEALKDEEINIKDRLVSLGQIALADLQSLASEAITIFESVLKAAVIK